MSYGARRHHGAKAKRPDQTRKAPQMERNHVWQIERLTACGGKMPKDFSLRNRSRSKHRLSLMMPDLEDFGRLTSTGANYVLPVRIGLEANANYCGAPLYRRSKQDWLHLQFWHACFHHLPAHLGYF